MMLGELLTYKDANLAVHLIGERFKFSNVLSETEHGNGISSTLFDVVLGNDYPFVFYLPGGDECYQFIREVVEDAPAEPRYEPYDLSDPPVRESLREKWIIWRDGDKDEAGEAMIIGFTKRDEYPWKVKTSIGGIDAAGLLKCYVFNDGTPCGRRVAD